MMIPHPSLVGILIFAVFIFIVNFSLVGKQIQLLSSFSVNLGRLLIINLFVCAHLHKIHTFHC